jgi:hypothetical protein
LQPIVGELSLCVFCELSEGPWRGGFAFWGGFPSFIDMN